MFDEKVGARLDPEIPNKNNINSKLEELINSSANCRPLICLEVNPPRGTELDGIFQRLEGRTAKLDFFNVTDSALARMKLAPIPFASLLKSKFGIEPLVNLTCRDRNLIALQGDLLAGWVLGIRAIVALTGDAVTTGDSPEVKGVFEINSIGLIQTINKLNSGKDIADNDLKGTPSYHAGVVVNPNARNPSAEIKRLLRKKEAGAKFALSQPVFEESVAADFFKEASSVGIPIMIGLLPIKSLKAVSAIEHIPGIRLSEAFRAKLSSLTDQTCGRFFLEHCLNIAKSATPFVRGFHVISGASPSLALDLVDALS